MRPDCFVVSSLAPRRTSSVLSRGSLRAFAHSGLLATLLRRLSLLSVSMILVALLGLQVALVQAASTRHKGMRFDMVFLRYAVGSLTGLRNLADNFACAPNSASLLQQVEADRFIGTIEHDTLQRLDNSWS